jgi:hypothetical protein
MLSMPVSSPPAQHEATAAVPQGVAENSAANGDEHGEQDRGRGLVTTRAPGAATLEPRRRTP